MAGTFWVIRGPEEAETRLGFLRDHLTEKGVWPIELQVKKFNKRRSVDQNALMWMWFTEIADFFTKGGRAATKDEVHDLMCHKFLGYEDRAVGELTIANQLRGTSKLDKGEMHHFLTQVEQWAINLGCKVTIPVASEYYELQQAQNN